MTPPTPRTALRPSPARGTPGPRAPALALLAGLSAAALFGAGGDALGQGSGGTGGAAVPAASSGSAGCAAVVQAAANGAGARVRADDARINPPQSVVNLSCLDNFFNGVGLNLVTNLLDPTNLLQQVQGKICSYVQGAWNSMLGNVQCGLTVSGFDVGFFGGVGGGLSCPSLSFGGGGPPIANVGLGVGAGGSGNGIYVTGNGLPPTGYGVGPTRPGSF